eukprot:NODE_2552_length_2190_cov_4.056714.p1 GENE.NODE_2552_length_2190_cov_4.056714~~NODE_2552_length_2190_cov_4.056714.p1  ORF type:complete len:693 (-),score=136.82 NODE_2552_length_2190_cov_4.056714:40-2118(-)
MRTSSRRLSNLFGANSEVSWLRLTLGGVLDSWYVIGCLTAIVVANVVIIVHEADLLAQDHAAPNWLHYVRVISLFIFVAELAARVYVYRKRFFNEMINLVDGSIVVADIIVQILEMFGAIVPGLSILRVCRLIKVVRLLRHVNSCREVYLIVSGLFTTMKSALIAMVMVICIVVLWSVISVHYLRPVNDEVAESGIYDGCERCPRAFESVFASSLTLLQQLIAGDSWGVLSIPIIEHRPSTAIIFALSMASVQLGVLNLVIGIIVDAIEHSRERDHGHLLARKEAAAEQAKKELLEVCHSMDVDGNGSITLAELESAFDENFDFHKALTMMDVGRDELPMLFQIMDHERVHSVSYDTFVEQLQHIKTQDSHTMLIFMKHHLAEVRLKLSEQVNIMEEQLLQAQVERDVKIDGIFSLVVQLAANTGVATSDADASRCMAAISAEPDACVSTAKCTDALECVVASADEVMLNPLPCTSAAKAPSQLHPPQEASASMGTGPGISTGSVVEALAAQASGDAHPCSELSPHAAAREPLVPVECTGAVIPSSSLRRSALDTTQPSTAPLPHLCMFGMTAVREGEVAQAGDHHALSTNTGTCPLDDRPSSMVSKRSLPPSDETHSWSSDGPQTSAHSDGATCPKIGAVLKPGTLSWPAVARPWATALGWVNLTSGRRRSASRDGGGGRRGSEDISSLRL